MKMKFFFVYVFVVMCFCAPVFSQDVIGLQVSKPSFLKNTCFGFLTTDIAGWEALNADASRYGKLVGFSTEQNITGETKNTMCFALYSFPSISSGMNAVNMLPKSGTGKLELLENIRIDICWQRFNRKYHFDINYENIMELGHKNTYYLVEGSQKIAKELYEISEACKDPFSFTKKRYQNDCSYYLVERPSGEWMDVFSVKIQSSRLGFASQKVFEYKVQMNGSGKPFGIPAEHQNCWK
ncbi:MAG: hypothetical protein HQM10_10825 [Candidatus Riflebacteria bacterium]|nr:hypothetical protein [Candidatus Riflebacteria bacterium]